VGRDGVVAVAPGGSNAKEVDALPGAEVFTPDLFRRITMSEPLRAV